MVTVGKLTKFSTKEVPKELSIERHQLEESVLATSEVAVKYKELKINYELIKMILVISVI